MSRTRVFLIGLAVGLGVAGVLLIGFVKIEPLHVGSPVTAYPYALMPFTEHNRTVRWRTLDGIEVEPVAMGHDGIIHCGRLNIPPDYGPIEPTPNLPTPAPPPTQVGLPGPPKSFPSTEHK